MKQNEPSHTPMNRLEKLFDTTRGNEEKLLSLYCTAGYPSIDDTLRIVKTAADSGAHIIEIGIPFSDPIADGLTIQHSNKTALENGMTVKRLFEQLEPLQRTTTIPVLLMGYLNPILQYGFLQFCQHAAQVGITGFIIPDLPLYEYEAEYKRIMDAHNLINIFLITPQTSLERIRYIDTIGRGFIYAVSASATTGARSNIADEQRAYFERLHALSLRTPILIGFGISDRATFQQATQYADGAIIGSAFIKALRPSDPSSPLEDTIHTFVHSILDRR